MQPAVKRVFVGDRFFGLAEAYTAIEENLNQAELTVFLSHEWENYVGNQYDEIKKFVSAIKENQPQWKIFLILNKSLFISSTNVMHISFGIFNN